MKVLWLTNIPSPYRVDFFNELGKQCDLTVLFEKKTSAERDRSWAAFTTDNFEAIFLNGKNVGVAEAFCPNVISHIRKGIYDHIVVTNYSDPTGMLAVAVLKAKKISYDIEGDGAFAGSGKGLKERVKRWIISGADTCFSTSKEHDKYYQVYGAKKVVRYPFTSIRENEILGRTLPNDEKRAYKHNLGIKEGKMILAVGQFIPRKGFDILIRACKGLENTGCYIVGGHPPESYVQLIKEQKVENVHFVNFMLPEKLKKYYMAADVFVHPTREDIWGLVINEAMACGLPVVTTDRCIAGLEMVTDDSFGRIVPSEDVYALREAIEACFSDSGNGISQQKILGQAKRYTIEKMAKRHREVFEQREGKK